MRPGAFRYVSVWGVEVEVYLECIPHYPTQLCKYVSACDPQRSLVAGLWHGTPAMCVGTRQLERSRLL